MAKIVGKDTQIELSDQELCLLLEAFCVYRNKFNLATSRNFFGFQSLSRRINGLYDKIYNKLLTKTTNNYDNNKRSSNQRHQPSGGDR